MAESTELGPGFEPSQACVTAVSVLGVIHYTLLSARACGFLLIISIFTFVIKVNQQDSVQETRLSSSLV